MTRRAHTIVEVLVLIAVAMALLGAALPMLRRPRCDDRFFVSQGNLAKLHQAHAAYAADWNDRQFTVARDDLGVYGGDCALYAEGTGSPHPPLVLGEDCRGEVRALDYLEQADPVVCNGNFGWVRPFNFGGPLEGRGSFLIPNARGFHEYLNGRFFDPVFYAPRDEVVLDIVAPLLEVGCEYAADTVEPALYLSSSYSLSPAALFDPAVLADPFDGGFQDPDTFARGYRSPTVGQALYPAQKTRMLEQRWLQREPPEPCNDAFAEGTFDGCEPYYFCHAWESRPLTLFFDGHVRGLSVSEASNSDRRSLLQSGYGLWHRGTPLGASGYFGAEAWDFRSDNASFHVLTTNGILGRDTLE